jgi:hypothetical protein
MEFRYSRFYAIQPLCAFLFIGLLLTFIVYDSLNQIGAWLLLIGFLLFLLIMMIFRLIKVTKDPVLFRLDEESISVVYRDGRVDQLFWKAIKSIYRDREHWSIGLETIEITFKDGSERTLCNNFVKQYKSFKLAIAETASNKVAMVMLTDNKKRTTRKKA